MAPPIAATVNAVDPHHVIATFRNLSIIIWRVETHPAACRAIRAQSEQLAELHPDGIGLLTVIGRDAPMPSSESRGLISTFFAEAPYIKASGVAMEGTGFRAGAVRSVVAGLTMMARQPFPHKVFATVEETLVWMLPELNEKAGSRLTESEVVGVMEELREHVDRTVPKATR